MSTDMRGIYHAVSEDLYSVKIQLNLDSKHIVLAKNLPWEQMAEIANRAGCDLNIMYSFYKTSAI
jgi:hypothetical protein